MKHFFLFTFLFYKLCLSQSLAQKCFPVAQNNPEWHITIEQFGFMGNTYYKDTLSYLADTSICGQTYHHLILRNKPSAKPDHYLRSDADKVYYRKNTNCAENEVIIYDFSLNVDDSLNVKGIYNFKFKIVKKDSIYLNNQWKRRLQTNYQAFGNKTYEMDWVEGVGSSEHPLYNVVPLLSYEVDGKKFYTDCFFESKSLIHSFSGSCPSTLIDTTVFPMFKDKGSWNVLASNGAFQMNKQVTDYIFYDKDTAICGKIYSRIQFKNGSSTREVFVRTEGKKVFYYNQTPCEDDLYENVMYNFEMNDATDSELIIFPFDNKEYYFSPIKVDSILLFGRNRKRLSLKYESNDKPGIYFYDTWIEGIGSLKHPFYTHAVIFQDGDTYETLCSHSHSKQQYQNSKYKTCWVSSVATDESKLNNIAVDIFPIPFQNQLTINVLENEVLTYDLDIFNLLGQKIFSTTINQSITIDTTFMPQGTFIIHLTNKNGRRSLVKKVLKVD